MHEFMECEVITKTTRFGMDCDAFIKEYSKHIKDF